MTSLYTNVLATATRLVDVVYGCPKLSGFTVTREEGLYIVAVKT